MSRSDQEAAVAAFIRINGVTRCPTACLVRTQGTVSQADREALQRRAIEAEILRHRRRIGDPLAALKGRS
jgi:hypothetical protein